MARIRSLKPGFFRSRSLTCCSVHARLTFAGLWVEADDYGRGIADALVLKGSLWPRDRDITEEDVEKHLQELADTEHIILYAVGADRYYEVINWEKHQAAAYRRGKAVYPPLDHAASRVQENATACKDVLEKGDGNREGREEGADVGAEAFSLFWDGYPRKPEDEGPARRAFHVQREHWDDIMAGLIAWKDFWALDSTDPRFVPYPENFLIRRKYLERPGPVTLIPATNEPVLARITPSEVDWEELPDGSVMRRSRATR